MKWVFDTDISVCPFAADSCASSRTAPSHPSSAIRKILIHLQQRAPLRMPQRYAEPHRILHDPFAPH